MLTRSLFLQLGRSKRMESFVRGNDLSRKLTHRFVAGETIEEALPAVRALNGQGNSVSLDYLGESVSTADEVAAVVDTYLRLFQVIRAENLDANVSLKLTALGLDIDPDLCVRSMERLLHAAGPDQFVRIDMEDSARTQATLDLFYRLWNGSQAYRNVGVVIQAYLRRSPEDIERLIEAGARVRLCKGAYQEPPEVAYPDKRDVDRQFVGLMQRLLESGNYPGIATHDPAMIAATQQLAREHGISPDRFEFQMLYGIRRDLQIGLVREGYRLRVYTPFGSHWYPYFMRRLAERPENIWFVMKSLLKA